MRHGSLSQRKTMDIEAVSYDDWSNHYCGNFGDNPNFGNLVRKERIMIRIILSGLVGAIIGAAGMWVYIMLAVGAGV